MVMNVGADTKGTNSLHLFLFFFFFFFSKIQYFKKWFGPAVPWTVTSFSVLSNAIYPKKLRPHKDSYKKTLNSQYTACLQPLTSANTTD